MAVHSEKITDRVAKSLPAPESGYTIYWCPRTEGFGVRVTSTGARAWVAERRLDGKTVRRTLAKVNQAAGTEHITPHCLRHTFATAAESLVSTYVLKRMLNHSTSGDVTAEHYVKIDGSRLRAGWQAVADFLDGLRPTVG